MNNKEYPHKLQTGTKGSLCPACQKGILDVKSELGGEPMTLICPICRTIFYKNAVGELVEMGTQEMIDEEKGFEQNRNKGKPKLPKHND